MDNFIRRVTTAAAVSVGLILPLLIVWLASHVFLVIFAGVLLALLLRTVSGWVAEKLGSGQGQALALVILLLIAVIGGALALMGARIAEQVDEIARALPEAFQNLLLWLRQYKWGRQITREIPGLEDLAPGGELALPVGRFFSLTFSVVAGVVFFLFIGVYVAAEPHRYYNGLLHLIPPDKRERTREVLRVLAHELRWWLLGQSFSMLFLFVSVTTLLHAFGIPMALTLGLIIGVIDFVPYLGPILGFVPVAVLAFTQGFATGASVLVFYTAIQSLEGYFITPMIQRKVVLLPPALLLSSQFLMGVLAGPLGVVLATPLVVAVMVLVQEVYVDWLGDDTFSRRRRY